MSLRLCIILSVAFVGPAAAASFFGADWFFAGFAYGMGGTIFLLSLRDLLAGRL